MREKEHERRKKEQVRARQIEAKVKWEQTKTKTCPVCDNPFHTQDWEEMACSKECYREFRRVQDEWRGYEGKMYTGAGHGST